MDAKKHEAEAMLGRARDVGGTVRARAPQEAPLYLGMGLTILLIGLAVDLNDLGGPAAAVGTTLVLLAVAVTLGTHLPYLRRHRQVRTRSTPQWVEWALGLWSAAALFGLGLLLDDVAGSFTLGGLVGALPFLLWTRRLRRRA